MVYTSFQYQIHTEPVSTQGETVTESRWHQPWSEPVRQKINGTLAIALMASGLFMTPQQAGETIRPDKWYQALSEPVRIKPQVRTGLQGTLLEVLTPEPTFESKWHYAWSEPVRLPRRLPTGLNQAVFYTALPNILPRPDWYNWLSEPVRFKPGLRHYLQSFLAEDSKIVFVPPTGSLNGWYEWFGEPRRFKQGLGAYLQQFFAYHPRILPTPNVTGNMNAFEVNADIMLMAINVVQSNPANSAIVSIQEISFGNSAASVRET